MSETRESPRDDDIRFDRLVDGELTSAQYQELLESLDNQPDGWRRCALAFLEAQAWQRELQAVRAEGDRPAPCVTVNRPVWSAAQIASLLLAMAASFLVAFGLGVALDGWWPANHAPLVVDRGAGEPEKSLADSRDNAPGEDSDTPPVGAPSSDARNRPWGSMTLAVDRGDGSAEEIDLPVYDYRDEYARWLMENTTPVPLEMRRTLRRLGYEVRRDRRWTPVYVDKGRAVFLPIDQVEITPVSSRSFQ